MTHPTPCEPPARPLVPLPSDAAWDAPPRTAADAERTLAEAHAALVAAEERADTLAALALTAWVVLATILALSAFVLSSLP